MTKDFVNKVVMIVVLISAIVLIGWLTDHAALAVLLPSIANITFNTALCFILLAVVIFRLNRNEATAFSLCRFLSAFVALVAMLPLLQDVFSVRWGIDNLLLDSHAYDVSNPYSGRMSPATTAGFLLSSSILFLLLSRKKIRHFGFVTHTLILLLGLLALLGISMNILVPEAPEGYEYLTSISMLTAISFLLLVIAMLGICEQKVQGGNLVLYSGIHLMYRLKYPQKFTLISMLFVIPLSVLMWSEIREAEQDVAAAQLKMLGIEHIDLTEAMVKSFAEHRGMTNASFSNSGMFRQALQQKTAQIDKILLERHRMIQRHSQQQRHISRHWTTQVDSRWAMIKKQGMSQLQQWQAHTEIIDFLIHHMRDVGEESGLAFEEEPRLHNLLTMQLEVMPKLLENIAQLRGQGAGFLTAKRMSRDGLLMLATMVGQIQTQLETLERVARLPMASQNLEACKILFVTFRAQVEDFLAATERMFHSEQALSITSVKYFQMATETIERGYAFNNTSMVYVTDQLQKQIADNKVFQYNIKLAAVLLALILLFLFASFYKSVINTIRALDETAERMRRGDIGKPVELLAKDELGNVANSFNGIVEELMRVSAHMSAVVNHVLEGIITIDKKGAIKSFNPAAEHIFGYSKDEVLEQNITILMPEKYRERHQIGLQHYCQTEQGNLAGTGGSIEVRGLKKDGSEFPMALSINVMEIDKQQVFIGMVSDLSEHRSLEKQFRQAQKMQALGVLVGGVAHNFNNLLGAIVGKAYLGKKKLQHDVQAIPYLDAITDISQQAGEMVKQLLAFSHKDFSQDKQAAQIGAIVEEGFATAKFGVEESINLSLHIHDADMMVHCDAGQIQQVVMNMLNNARDAVAESSERCITLSLERCSPKASFFYKHPELTPGEYALLSISDSGHGMSPEIMENIFDPFFTSKAVGQGTGLGLSSAFGSVTSHGGVIEVDSKVSSGSMFRVYLPLIDVDEVSSDSVISQVVKSSACEMLLLVDDEQMLLQSMKEVLEDLGYKVITACNGIEGLECFKQYGDKISVVITDVVMPRMGGVDMSREIRQTNALVPIILVTGYDHGDVKLEGDEKKNTMVITKPVQIPELSQAICKVLAMS